jgi:hypothetical protein
VQKKVKPLNSYEQSSLLLSLLFSRNHIDEILAIFPKAQSERMQNAKNRFLRMEQGERVTQIIFELKRLLESGEKKITWIHPSWILKAISCEAPYLQETLKSFFESKEKLPAIRLIPAEIIRDNFLLPFLKIPKKNAFYEAALIRLQAFNRYDQNKALACIGQKVLDSCSHMYTYERVIKFLNKNFILVNYANNNINITHNINDIILKKSILRFVKKNYKQDFEVLKLNLGLLLLARYLSFQKPRWQKIIIYTLSYDLGQRLKIFLRDFPDTAHNETSFKECETLLLLGLDSYA